MDIGCYLVYTSRLIFGEEPSRVMGLMEADSEMRTDVVTSGILHFSSGHSVFTCSTQLCPYQRVQIFGNKGRIEIEIPFNAPSDKPCRIFVDDGKDISGRSAEIVEFEICDQYTIQAQNRRRRRTAAPPRWPMRRSDPFPYPLPGGPLLRTIITRPLGTTKRGYQANCRRPPGTRPPPPGRRAPSRRGPASARSRHRAGIRPRRRRRPSGRRPEAEESQRNRRRHEHHRDEKQRPRHQHVVLEAVAGRVEPGPLGPQDGLVEIPERHRFGRREGLAHLRLVEVRGEEIAGVALAAARSGRGRGRRSAPR